MIPVKIISKEQAVRLGLASYENDEKGESVAGAMAVASKDPTGKETITERAIVRVNGKKELIFMHEDRKKEMLERNQLADYVDQFEKIEGKEKATFLKENNLKISESK